MAGWADLGDELDRWAAAGRVATFWWRDDDATTDGPALRALLDRARAIPVYLAVIPGTMHASLATALAAAPLVTVLQHGFRHRNYAPSGQGARELGGPRPRADVLAELGQGHRLLRAAFGRRYLPVLVPPWNRIADTLLPDLTGCGFCGLSRFGPRAARLAAPDLVEIGTHCDPLAWKGGPRFVGQAGALDDVCKHLQARRTGRVDPDEPTGLLTHHRDMDRAAWHFMDALWARTMDHPGADWSAGLAAFFPGQAAPGQAARNGDRRC